jgi:hypothetical protein
MINMAKKLTPASIVSQKKWGGLPIAKKNDLRKMLPDRDKDGVPDKYDCHPKNRRRQEEFTPSDTAYLESHSKLKPSQYVASGHCGDVYLVSGNKNLVIKTPKHMLNNKKSTALTSSERKKYLEWKEDDMNDEISAYKNYDLNKLPLFAPSKVINIKSDFDGKDYACIVRPKVTPVMRHNKYDEPEVDPWVKKRLTDAKLEQLRRDLIRISHLGISLEDGLQIGMDTSGRLLIYDAGRMRKYAEGSDIPFEVNNGEWLNLLADLGKLERSSQWAKYGAVSQYENY